MLHLIESAGVKSAGGRPYSPGIRAGDWLCLSGQVPIDANGVTVAADPASQWRQCLENIKTLLATQGASMADVAFLWYYVTDMDNVYLAHGDIRREYFLEPFPAGTVIQTPRLAQPDWLIEIQAFAYRGV